MASFRSLLSKEQFQCSLCLDVFTDPVTTPCRHNFCMACIKEYWDSSEHCQCPVCKEKFSMRPELCVNAFISEPAAQFRESDQLTAWSTPAKSGVPCDIFTGRKLRVLKICLLFLAIGVITYLCVVTSRTRAELPEIRESLMISSAETVSKLEESLHKEMEKLPEIIESLKIHNDEETLIKALTKLEESFNKTIDMLPKEETLRKAVSKLEESFNKEMEKLPKINESLMINVADTLRAVSKLEEAFNKEMEKLPEIIESLKIHNDEETLIKALTKLEESFNKTIDMLPKEETLRKAVSKLEESFNKEMEKLPKINESLMINVADTLRAVSKLEEAFNKEILPEIEMKKIQRYAVDVTLDPDTAHPWLFLSEDGKQVRLGDTRQSVTDNPERFNKTGCVLGNEGFSSGRFYYEVQVRGKTMWDLGVARESINRKGQVSSSPVNGHWVVYLRNGTEYKAAAGPYVPLSLREKPPKVGVFVDYEEGLVSFYDVGARSLIYSFTGQSFTEKLYPFFCPCLKSKVPLIISPVSHIR